MKRTILHGSAVSFGDKAVFLRGLSGAGKSDVALRLIEDGGLLISDDQVEFERRRNQVYAGGIESIRGLIEVRGVGLLKYPVAAPAPLKLIVSLVDRKDVPRLPEWETEKIMDVAVPCLKLHAFDASTPLKIRKALEAVEKPEMLVK